ncbi:MAG TPA: glycyl-radical enzyme activating protein [Armatimonadota bacterium]|nr:glycyl-radical enzyme activating protein [Armatimonadota bacterium]HPO74226.1 glycyl-radical enzyme activating protein [Armatimonadota bacterium]
MGGTARIIGRIFDIQRFSVHDGPGIRTTVFFQGCPLRCRWCHNPEALSYGPALFYNDRSCFFCRACEAACTEAVHSFVGEEHRMHRERCRLCGACAAACVTGALEISGRTVTPEEVVEVVLRDRVFYETSGGGVTLSGGEPLAQPAFAGEILARCRAEGLHTAVDTCGEGAREALDALIPLADLWLFDVKHLDPEAHRAATGRSNERILQNLRYLDSVLCREGGPAPAGARLVLRVPLIPRINDTPENLAALAALARELPSAREMRLLPYHRFQEDKYRRLGREYPGTDLVPPDDATVKAIRERLAAEAGIIVGIGG